MSDKSSRKVWMDNLRWFVIILVVLFHVTYLFNCVGAATSIQRQGISWLDGYAYMVYPWFMGILFVLAGISARYSLRVRSAKEFLRSRVDKLLVPSIGCMVLIGWIAGWISGECNGVFNGLREQGVPGFVLAIMSVMMGISVQWFLQELFLLTLVLLLIRKIDKKDRLKDLGEKLCSMPALFLLTIFYVISNFIGNIPYMTSYRNGAYLFLFLLGYEVFYQEKMQDLVKKYAYLFLGIAIVAGVIQCWYYWGIPYTTYEYLTAPLVSIFSWFAILAGMGLSMHLLDEQNRFTEYMTKNSFGIYMFHYTPMVVTAYFLSYHTNCSMGITYLSVCVMTLLFTPVMFTLFPKIPVVRYLLLGIRKKRTIDKAVPLHYSGNRMVKRDENKVNS